MDSTPNTITVKIPESERELIAEETGVPFVTPALTIKWLPEGHDYGPYLSVEHMEGLNDFDIKWIVTELAKGDDLCAKQCQQIVAFAGGFVSGRTPHLPSHTRIYVD